MRPIRSLSIILAFNFGHVVLVLLEHVAQSFVPPARLIINTSTFLVHQHDLLHPTRSANTRRIIWQSGQGDIRAWTKLKCAHIQVLNDTINDEQTEQQVDYPRVTIDDSSASENRWVQEAADKLEKFGACVLTRTSDAGAGAGNNGVLSDRLCDTVDQAVMTRMEDLHGRIRNRGMDPQGVDDGPYRFREIVSRDEGGNRFDIPTTWCGSSFGEFPNLVDAAASLDNDNGAPEWSHDLTKPLAEFHANLHSVIHPILEEWQDRVKITTEAQRGNGDTNSTSSNTVNNHLINVAASGFLVNRPGSQAQHLHRDGPDPGYIDVFVPLITIKDMSLGPTELVLGTHTTNTIDNKALLPDNYSTSTTVVPLLNKGDILLFDYRLLHRGLGNTSKNDIVRTLAYVVYSKQQQPHSSEGSSSNSNPNPAGQQDIHNFPAALTLEFD
jgi:hypothetical protein